MRKVHFAIYLNDIWKSMILRDDEYVTGVFDQVHEDIPEESPQCLIHKLFAVGCMLLEARWAISDGDLETVRGVLCQSNTEMAVSILGTLYATPHECTGIRYEELSKQNPDEPFFQMKVRK